MSEVDDESSLDVAGAIMADLVGEDERPVWHREPKIKPNYGKQKKTLLPQSSIKNVLFYNNANENRKLQQTKGHIEFQERWAAQIYAVQRKSFVVRQILQEQHLQSKGIKVLNLIPKSLKAEFKHHAMFHNISKYGAKDLPMWHRLDKAGLQSTQAKFTKDELEREAMEKERENQFRQSLAHRPAPNRRQPRISSGDSNSSLGSVSSESGEQLGEKLPPIQRENTVITVTRIPLKNRPFSTYNTRVRKEHTIAACGHPVHRQDTVVDPRFERLSKSLSHLEGRARDNHDPFLRLSESSWGDMPKLEKSDSDIIHKKYMPLSCAKKKLGSGSKLLFPKAMSLIERYKYGEAQYNADEE